MAAQVVVVLALTVLLAVAVTVAVAVAMLAAVSDMEVAGPVVAQMAMVHRMALPAVPLMAGQAVVIHE